MRIIPFTTLMLLAAGAASAQTPVPSGNLVGSQTWTAAGSPYVLQGDLTVPTGLTLTLEPGAVVHLGPGDDQSANLDTNRAELRVAGTLVVNGTPASPVTLRSGAATPSTSDFFGLVALPGASVTATSLRVERAHRGIYNQASGATFTDLSLVSCNQGFVDVGGSATVNGGTIQGATSYGISLSGGASFTGDGLSITGGNSRGLSASGATVQLTDSVIAQNGSYGVYMTSGSAITSSTLSHNTIVSNNSYGVYLTGSSNNRVTVRDNLIADNRTYGVYRSSSAQVTASYNLTYDNGTEYSGVSAGAGARSENPLLVDLAGGDYAPTSNSGLRSAASDGTDIGAVPYAGAPTAGLVGHLYTNTVLTAAASPHTVLGDLTVEPGVTLTLEAGAEVRFAANADLMAAGAQAARGELRVQGTLTAVGTAANPVVLTSSGTGRGDWYGVYLFDTTSGTTIDHASIRYAQYGIRSSATAGNVVRRTEILDASSYALWKDGDAVTFDQMDIHDNASRGVSISGGASGGLTNSLVYDNSSYGLYATSGSSIGNLSVTGNTIVDNGSYGVYLTGSSNNRVTLRDNVIVGNRTYGVYRTSSAQVTASYNLVWDNGTEYSGVSAGSGAISENPLFVDQTNEDFRITRNSPARNHASGGGDMGALAYDGAPTVGLLGHLYADTLLSRAGSPHVVQGDLTVEPGVTLTIEPGATLAFAAGADQMGAGASASRTELRVLGSLVADGTVSRRITFTSDASTGSRGDWYGVHLLAASSASIIDYATIEFAQYGVRTSAPSGTVVQRSTIRESSSYAVWSDGGADFSELVVRDNASRAFHMTGASGSITGCQIYDNSSYGIYATSGSAISNLTITDNTIVDNNSYGVYLTGSANNRVTVRDNIVTDNRTYGIYRSSSAQVTASYNLVWRNGTDYSGVSAGAGAISENPLYVAPGSSDYRITSRSPARMHASDGSDMGALAYDGALTVGEQGHIYSDTTWAAAMSPIDVLGDITVEPGATLTIEPGVTVRFAGSADSMGGNTSTSRTELIVLGRLQVNGTAGARVVLGSASASAGAWYGVHLRDTAASSSIRNAHIRYAQYGLRSSAPSSASVTRSEISDCSSYGAWIDGGGLVMDGVYIHDNSSRGVSVQGASPTLTNLVITDNSSYGVYVTSGGSITNTALNHLTVDNNNSYGLYFTGSSNNRVTVRNSSITNNRTYGVYRSSSAQVTLGTNNVWTNGTDYSGVSAGSGSISVNPQFVNPALDNYQLLPSSTLIDAADPATAATSDFEGTVRPLDGDSNTTALPDLGAFEFNPSSNRFPIADAGPDRVATAGLAIGFDASGSSDPDGTIASYAWDFGDGSTGTGVTVSHTYTGGTDRTVTLTVTDNNGAIDVDTVSVEVNLAPTAEAGPPKFGDPGEIITFVGTGSSDSDGSIVGYAWSFGDGTSASGSNVTHQYTSPGTFTVTLTVTDDDGATGSDTTTVDISGADLTPPTLVHAPVPNGRPAGQAVTVSADVTDASGVASATLYYRAIGASTFTSAAMSNTSGATWSAAVPAAAVTTPGVEYYVAASDNATPANSATQPSNAPTGYFTFTVNAPPAPTITHTPIADGQAQGQAVTVSADVSAAAGVASVTLRYRAPGGSFTTAPMSAGAGSTYAAQIPAAAVQPPSVEYYIEALDQATPAQSVSSPPSPGAVHAFAVTATDTSPPSITHTPIAGMQPAGQPVTVAATITDPSGVASASLYYRATGGSTFTSVAMTGAAGTFSAYIPAAAVTPAGVDYYLEATDQASPANSGTHPAGGPGAPLSFTVQRVFDVRAGDLVISEIMADPSGTESEREWFEVYNTTGDAIDLDGFTFSDDGVDAFTVSNGGPLMVASGGYLVFGRSADTNLNGGVTVDYVYSGMALANTSDEIVISAGALEVDRVAYDAGATFPRSPGYSLSLDPTTLDATANDAGGSWCLASSPLASGDFGSPGFANDSCADIVAPALVHTPIADGQQAGLPIAVSAVVTDDSGLDAVEVYYRVRGQGAYDSASMTLIGADVYQGEIPASHVTTAGVEYYLRAVDAAPAANETLEPSGAPNTVLAFDVTTDDTSGPSINHNPVADEQPAGGTVEIIASVGDPAGVQEVLLHARAAGGAWSMVSMTELGQDVFRAEIPSDQVTAAGVEYYIEATDGLGNAASLPADGAAGPFTFTVVVPDLDEPVITHTPVAGPVPAGAPIEVEAEITDPSGLAEVRLYFQGVGQPPFVSVQMTEAGGRYAASIPAALVTEAGVEYYIEAVDASPEQNVARHPSDAPGSAHRVEVEGGGGEDTEPPSLLHIAIAGAQPAGRAIRIVAEIVDPSSVDAALVRYRTQGATDFVELPLAQVGGTDRYEADIPGGAVVAPGLEYYLVARDTLGNEAQRPMEAPSALYSVTVTPMGGGGDPREDGGCRCVVAPSGRAAGGLLLLGALLGVRRRRRPTR